MTVDKKKIEHYPVVLYDGECSMCNTSVQFILRHEKNQLLKFSPLESVDEKFPELSVSTSQLPDAIHFIIDDKVLIESDAIIAISQYLKWPYSMIQYIKIIPKPLRDFAYRAIAKRRRSVQSLFKNSCDLYADFGDRMV